MVDIYLQEVMHGRETLGKTKPKASAKSKFDILTAKCVDRLIEQLPQELFYSDQFS
ncbi:MAG: hypothetical protein H0V82_10260 [Candidatus Protochlamydia sp.]|nr:hypothetical protein [Candidatus Protochlamydia sp.]